MESILREWKIEDIPYLVKHANNPNVIKYLTDGFPYPYTYQDAETFINAAITENPPRLLAIVLDDKPIGSIGIFPQADVHCKNAEIGYFLGEEFWGKGFMTKAVNQIVEYGFNTFNINRIFARPFGVNIASHRVLEKAGFQLEAQFKNTIYKNGVCMDELIYAIRKPEI